MDKLKNAQNIKELYEAFNKSQQFGIQFGMFPLEAKEPMERLNISACDLMQFDQNVRAQRGEKKVTTR